MRTFHELRANLAAGLRLAFLMPVGPERIRGSGLTLVLLFAMGVLLHLARDILLTGAEGSFFAYGLPGVLLMVPVLLAAAVVVAWVARRSADTLTLATAFAALSVPVIGVEMLLTLLPGGGSRPQLWPRWASWEAWAWAFPSWLALAAGLASFRLLRPTSSRMSAAAIAIVLLVALPLGSIYRDRTLWMKPYDEDSTERRRYMAAASEDAFYHQPKVMARTLQALAPGRPGRIDLYYVGMGGYAQQDVFLREVKAVQALMVERFGAEGRTASLLNNPQTIMDTPIASVTSLRAVLRRVGEAMNRDEDILFLYMTSHGSRDHKFALEFWPLQFNDLTPQVLRAALDDARIKWRVVVVSACYAGGFIDALKDEHTVVIAAAAPDRRSFGCSNEAQWTYFGQAFFDESLRTQPRLTEAFATARESVLAREKRESITPSSDPRMAAGQPMARHWDAYLAQLASPGTVASARAPDARAKTGPADELVALRHLAETARAYAAECRGEMLANSPVTYVDKDPAYFGNIRKDTPQWPQLVAAWERYAEEYCGATSEALMRKAYTAAWRHSADQETMRAALRFYRETRTGRRLLEAENRVAAILPARIVEATRPTLQAATSRYTAELARLQAEARPKVIKAKAP